MATVKTHRNRWIELRPLHDQATLRKLPEEDRWEFCGDGMLACPKKFTYEFDSNSFEIICHDKPTENLQKLLDLGYKEGAARRILDTLGLD